MNTLFPGAALGRYELLVPLGKGGMAQVWAARLHGSRGFQKIVAIKTIAGEALDSERMESMFLEEATLASQIHHPNVVGTLELGEHEGTLYLVMEWVHGEPLDVVLKHATREGGLPLPIAVNLIAQACKGLHAAHELRDENGLLLGVVHRDISAQNVLVTYSGTAKLVDFGIAKITARASALTEQGEVKGKFAYMSPEQVCGQPIDRRSDVFGMGILLYLLTTGKHPFRGQNPAETVRNICAKEAPESPACLVPGYPPALAEVVQKALRKSADERFASAHELLTALESAQPACLDASSETQVAKYLSELFGSRAADRMETLRRAQQLADLSRTESLSTISSSGASSVSSLRAVSIDPLNFQHTGSAPPASGPILEVRQSSAAPGPAPFKRQLRVPVSALAAGAVVVVLLGFELLRSRRTVAASGASASAPESGSELALALPKTASPIASARTAASVDPLAGNGASAAVPGPAAHAAAEPPRDKTPQRSAPRVLPPASGALGHPNPRAGAAANGSPAPALPTTPASRAVNAWDDSNYGGRR